MHKCMAIEVRMRSCKFAFIGIDGKLWVHITHFNAFADWHCRQTQRRCNCQTGHGCQP